VWASEEVEVVPCLRERYGVTSNIWQSRRSEAYLVELLYVTDMRCCLTPSLCETCAGLWLFVSLIASCNELWWFIVRWLWKFSKLTVYLDISTALLSTEQYSRTWIIFWTRIFCFLLYDGLPSSCGAGRFLRCINNNNNNYYYYYLLQLGCYPVAMVILHVN